MKTALNVVQNLRFHKEGNRSRDPLFLTRIRDKKNFRIQKDVTGAVSGIIFSELTWTVCGSQIDALEGAGVSYEGSPGGFFWVTTK